MNLGGYRSRPLSYKRLTLHQYFQLELGKENFYNDVNSHINLLPKGFNVLE